MENKILVIGSANADLVIHSEKMPVLGETLLGGGFEINAGGKGLNQAVALAKLGGKVSFIGAVGKDAFGELLLKELRQNGVEFRGIRPDTPTGIAMITVVNGDNFIVLNEGANGQLTPDVIAEHEDEIAACDICVLQLEIPLDSVKKTIELAKKNGTKVVLNPAPFRKLSPEILKNVDLLIPNEHETFGLTNIHPDSEENCKKAVENLLGFGAKTVILTLGERGCVYNGTDGIVFHPAKQTTVVDTTSAGDTFIGAVTSKLSKGQPLETAIDFATKAAALTVSRSGASKSIPLESEIL